MSTQILSANENFNYFQGGDQIYLNSFTNLKYTEGVREVALKTDSFWFLDLIGSYQPLLNNHSFQVWKLMREIVYETGNKEKIIIEKKDSFNAICEDGNNLILKKQHIEFSDFSFDKYIVWCIDGVCLLPSEY